MPVWIASPFGFAMTIPLSLRAERNNPAGAILSRASREWKIDKWRMENDKKGASRLHTPHIIHYQFSIPPKGARIFHLPLSIFHSRVSA
jgi:hypothetical protein